MAKQAVTVPPAIKPSNSKPFAKSLAHQFRAALGASTPLVAITTADPFSAIEKIVSQSVGKRAFISWDVVRGFLSHENGKVPELKEVSQKALAKMGDPSEAIGSMMVACTKAAELPPGSVLFLHNAQRFLDEPQAIQAVSNLRDRFKADRRCLVLVGVNMKLPVELQNDVVVLDEPLPDAAELADIVVALHPEINTEDRVRAVEALQGLSAFAAEQVLAMSLEKQGDGSFVLDMDALWDRKRQQIEQTPGISVSKEGIKFDDLGGLDNVKLFLKRLVTGNGRPNAIVFIDEIEKMVSDGQGDTSGVSKDQLGTLLSYMADTNAAGVLMVGHPGSGKSAAAKAVGNEVGIPTIKLDLGAAKGSLVGQSEHQLRDALKVISAVSNGSTLWIATSNGIQHIPPEMRARFKSGGPFFFDLPNDVEREAIWKVHRKRYGIKATDKQPTDEGWVGREIEQCCELAWRLNESLEFASQYVAPLSQAAPEKIESLRNNADGKWLSASHPGFYKKNSDAVSVSTIASQPGKRTVGGGFDD